MSQLDTALYTFIPEVRRKRFSGCKFKASLDYTASHSRAALARDLLLLLLSHILGNIHDSFPPSTPGLQTFLTIRVYPGNALNKLNFA